MASATGEGEPVFLDRALRGTRGKRMTKLLDEEIEDDEQFWNQDALKEEENDDSYEEEGEAVDEFDSDFNDEEPEPDDEVENEVVERVKKKKLVFPGKQATKKKNKKKVAPKLEQSTEDVNPPETEEIDEPEQQEVPDEAEGERTVRKSTRTAVIVRQAEREAIRAALQATMKPIKRKKEGEEKRMTQEEMLLEAAQTEVRNLRNLERVLAREEEVKKKAVIHKEVYTGPQIRYCSRDGKTFLQFSKGLSFQSELCTVPDPYPHKPVCAVTGLPAKYCNPKTRLPYATLDAFKIIRQKFLQEEAHRLKQENMDMGSLFSLISEEGIPCKRRRSRAGATARTSHLPRRVHFQSHSIGGPRAGLTDPDED